MYIYIDIHMYRHNIAKRSTLIVPCPRSQWKRRSPRGHLFGKRMTTASDQSCRNPIGTRENRTLRRRNAPVKLPPLLSLSLHMIYYIVIHVDLGIISSSFRFFFPFPSFFSLTDNVIIFLLFTHHSWLIIL